MPMSRVQKNQMRSDKGPRTLSNNMGKELVPGKVLNPTGGGTQNKQYSFPKGVKNSGPKYKQPDPRTEGKSGPLSVGVAPKLVK